MSTETIGEFEKNFSEMLGRKPDWGVLKGNKRRRIESC